MFLVNTLNNYFFYFLSARRNTQNGHADELLGLSDSLSGKTLEDDAQFTKSLDSFT